MNCPTMSESAIDTTINAMFPAQGVQWRDEGQQAEHQALAGKQRPAQNRIERQTVALTQP